MTLFVPKVDPPTPITHLNSVDGWVKLDADSGSTFEADPQHVLFESALGPSFRQSRALGRGAFTVTRESAAAASADHLPRLV